MFKTRELAHIILAIIIIMFVLLYKSVYNNQSSPTLVLTTLIFVAIAIFTNILVKKISAYYQESTITMRLWETRRYGLRNWQKFKTALPTGIIIPFLCALFSYGSFIWMAVLGFDLEETPARASKRHGRYKFSQITDLHLGFIAVSGIIANLILAIIAYLANFPELARISIYYTTYSLLPIGNLDGTKILFMHGIKQNLYKTVWGILLIICLIFLAYSFMLV